MEEQRTRRVRLEKGLPEAWENVSVAGLGTGTLTVTNDSLLFTSKDGVSVGCDLDTIRSLSIPGRRILSVAFSSGGKIETLQFDFNCEIPHHHDNNCEIPEHRWYRNGRIYEQRSEAERCCARLHTLVPDVPVVGYRTMSDEEWREKIARVREILATDYGGPYGNMDTWNEVMEFRNMANCHEFMWTLHQATEWHQIVLDQMRKDLEIIAQGKPYPLVSYWPEGRAPFFAVTKEQLEESHKGWEEFMAQWIKRYGELHV
jgi:hypothetical protein